MKGRPPASQTATPTSPPRPLFPGKKPHAIFASLPNPTLPSHPMTDLGSLDEQNELLAIHTRLQTAPFHPPSHDDPMLMQHSMDYSSPKMEDYLDDMETVPPPPEDDLDY